jgi:hypothetical protein
VCLLACRSAHRTAGGRLVSEVSFSGDAAVLQSGRRRRRAPPAGWPGAEQDAATITDSDAGCRPVSREGGPLSIAAVQARR